MPHQLSEEHLVDWQIHPAVHELQKQAVAQSSNAGSDLGGESAGDEFGSFLSLSEEQEMGG